MKKFSILTICLNMEDEIANTITSVLNQTCTDYEYLIKDGLSQDRTVSIAETFAPAFAEKGIPYRVITESDSGIYDAMNQATREAQGEWVIFMNAGDWFASDSVLSQIYESGCLEDADVVYGDRIDRNENLYYYVKASAIDTIHKGLPFCHQSTLTKRRLLIKTPYSLQYKICSDYYYYLQLYHEGRRFVYLPVAISVFDVHGASSNWKTHYREKLSILEDMPVRDEESIKRIKQIIRKKKLEEFLHQHIFRYIPPKLRMKRRLKMRKKAGWKSAEEMFPPRTDHQ